MKLRSFSSLLVVFTMVLFSALNASVESNDQIENDIISNLNAAQSKKFIEIFIYPEESKSFSMPETVTNVISKGKPAVQHLILLLDHEDAHTRALALLCLQEISNYLVGEYKDLFKNKKKDINKAWENWWDNNKGKEQVDWLIDSLHEKRKDWINRVDRGITMLGDFGDPRARQHLIPFLTHPNVNTQYYAVIALAKLKEEASIPYLIQELKSEEGFVRRGMFARLKRLTGLDFGYDPDAPIEQREKSILKWEQWLKKNKSTPTKIK